MDIVGDWGRRRRMRRGDEQAPGRELDGVRLKLSPALNYHGVCV